MLEESERENRQRKEITSSAIDDSAQRQGSRGSILGDPKLAQVRMLPRAGAQRTRHAEGNRGQRTGNNSRAEKGYWLRR